MMNEWIKEIVTLKIENERFKKALKEIADSFPFEIMTDTFIGDCSTCEILINIAKEALKAGEK